MTVEVSLSIIWTDYLINFLIEAVGTSEIVAGAEKSRAKTGEVKSLHLHSSYSSLEFFNPAHSFVPSLRAESLEQARVRLAKWLAIVRPVLRAKFQLSRSI